MTKMKAWKKVLIFYFGITFLFVVYHSLTKSSTQNDPKPVTVAEAKSETIEVRFLTQDSSPYKHPNLKSQTDPTGKMLKGERVFVLEENGGWIRVRATKNDVGWSAWLLKNRTQSQNEYNLGVCARLHKALLTHMKSSQNNILLISKLASEQYESIRSLDECKYMRYSFRMLRKPYEGESVTPKEWNEAIRNFIVKSEL